MICAAASDTNPLDTVTDWSSQLSVGEQQRLAFARVLLSSPQLIIMDESTSALDVFNERTLYKVRHHPRFTFDTVANTVACGCWNLLR